MPAAVIGGAIAGVGSIGAAAIGAKAQSKAAKTAANAQIETAAQNNALQREIYGKNEGYLSPYVGRGNQAGDAIMELLGFDPRPQASNAFMQTQTPIPFSYTGPGVAEDYSYWGGNGSPAGGMGNQQFGQPQPISYSITPQTNAKSAFDRYRDSSGYQFRMNEGMNALASDFRGRGISQSGAAQKALLKYGQDYGSNEFGKYLGYLGNQQGVGLSAGSALAGVGQGYANAISANNNSAADAISNAALLRGQGQANLYGTAANALGQIGGSLISSYAKPNNSFNINPTSFF